MPGSRIGVSGYANLINKGANESQPDFALSKEDFPTLGGGPGGGAIGSGASMNQQHPLSQQSQQQANNNSQQLPNINKNNFQEQNLQVSLENALRKEAPQQQNQINANAPQKVNQQVPQLGLSKSPKPVQQQLVVPQKELTMDQILARGELFYDELNNCWLNVGEGIMKNQFGLLSLLQRSNYTNFDTMLTKGIDLMQLGLPINRNGLIVDTEW